ncbi:CHAP domain-containing protein [Facklamia hominis]|uniref:glucosaminidase domain-containing protein n=1 Tax=Facklamia hominis TaxID=178214 RepID=UPI0029D41334|nr:glucosaminidase domain-containing protein [Facklamia hominis]WPJ91095.1 CHAP domain-containing protein [Facklamia hominis]
MLKYQGAILSDETLNMLIKEAERLNVPPSYLIVKLHFEGIWGTSAVARQDNNLSGMTYPNTSMDALTRPSGVQVTRGGKRPANEGGNYIHYSSLDDFFKDWLYLIRRGGSYNIADSSTFDEAVKGMFRYGGAKYDYATMNLPECDKKGRYEAYLKGMKARRQAINQANNGELDKLDKGVDSMAVTANAVINEAKKWLGANKWGARHKQIIDGYNAVRPLPRGYAVKYSDDWCDTFVSFVAVKAGAKDLIGRECGVERHKDIFKSKGIWLGLVRPRVGDVIIFNWSGNRGGWGNHIGYVASVAGDRITTIEGNTTVNGQSTVAYNRFVWNSVYIQGYARPKYAEGGQAPKVELSGDIEQLARDGIAGKLGNGEDRKRLLGDKYEAVQTKINELLSGTTVEKVQEKQQEAIEKVSKSEISDEDKNEIIQGILELVKAEDIKAVIEKALKD